MENKETDIREGGEGLTFWLLNKYSLSVPKEMYKEWKKCIINFLNPNIGLHILHTLSYTFPLILTGRICLTIKAS